MARRRSIATKISLSEQVDQLSDQAAMLFTWMIPHADDFGRLPGSVKKLAGMVVPLRRGRPGWSYEDIEGYLFEMESTTDETGTPLIARYQAENGITVIQLIKFDEHQDGLHKRTESQFPNPPANFSYTKPTEVVTRNFREVPGNSRLEEEGETKEKRNEGEVEREGEGGSVKGETQTAPNGTPPCGAESPESPVFQPDMTETESAVLTELHAVQGFPCDTSKDLILIRTLAVEFSGVDLPLEARNWRVYKLDKPLDKKSNPRLQFRHWCEIAAKKQKGAKGNIPRAAPKGIPRAFQSLQEFAAEAEGG